MHSAHADTSSHAAKKHHSSSMKVSDLRELRFPERSDNSAVFSRDAKLCVTFIIGGTNVRLCVSPRGSAKPAHTSATWKELRKELSGPLKAKGIDFSQAHDVIYPVLAKRMAEFLETLFPPKEGPVPIDNLRGLYFSVAGRVNGDERNHPGISRPLNGINAEVTTTNTGLSFINQKLGREIFQALKAEIPGFALSEEKVFVANDARAAVEGEILSLGVKDGILVEILILGTGFGGASSDGTFDEDGHRLIKDNNRDRIIVLRGKQLNRVLNPDGSFKDLPPHLVYAENLIAGPWVAIRFLKSLLEKPTVLVALAKKIAAKDPARKGTESTNKGIKKVLGGLYKLADLKHEDRSRWAINSDSFLLREVSEMIFQPNYQDIHRAIPSDMDLGRLEQKNPEAALTLLAWGRQKSFLRELGMMIGAKHAARAREGKKPAKIILAGGLGEMFNRYPPVDRQDALDIIVKHAKLPPGVCDFSRLTPEARDCAMALATAEAAEREEAATGDRLSA